MMTHNVKLPFPHDIMANNITADCTMCQCERLPGKIMRRTESPVRQ